MTTAREIAENTVYTENRSAVHDEITRQMVDVFIGESTLKAGDRILDIGCGMGPAWEPFRKHDISDIWAITPNEEEILNAIESGINAFSGMMGDTVFTVSFHGVWCRHVLEHSFSPLSDLLHIKNEFLFNGGWLYVEVPAPDTVCHHELNQNHFSVLGDSMWKSLFNKAGFELVRSGHIDVGLEIGLDKYFYYVLRAPGSEA